jgi:hypothetical protein
MTERTPHRQRYLTRERLFTYASKFTRRHERHGEGTIYPTMRQAAKYFGVSIDQIEEVADEGLEGERYLGLATAVRAGSGVANIEPRGAWLVEAYE